MRNVGGTEVGAISADYFGAFANGIQALLGYNGYLPAPRHHELAAYETWRAKSSYLEVGASPKYDSKPPWARPRGSPSIGASI